MNNEKLIEQPEPVGQKPTGKPNPAWVRGKCPDCGDAVVSNLYYIGGKGYQLRWECVNSLGESATCEYKRIL